MDDHSRPSLDVEKLAQRLSTGFETLLKEIEDLAHREATLRKQLEVAKKEVSIRFSQSAFFPYDEKPKLALDRKSCLLSSCVGERALHVLPDRISSKLVSNIS